MDSIALTGNRKGIVLVTAGTITLVGVHRAADIGGAWDSVAVSTDEYGAVMISRFVQKLVAQAVVSDGRVYAASLEIHSHQIVAFVRLGQQKSLAGFRLLGIKNRRLVCRPTEYCIGSPSFDDFSLKGYRCAKILAVV